MKFFYLAQFFGVIALITNVAAILVNNRKSVFKCNGISNVASVIQYLLLGKVTGAVSGTIATLRNIVFSRYKDRPPVYVFIIYVLVALIFNLPFCNGVMSIIPIFNIILYGFGIWQTNMETLKIINVVSGLAGMVYDMYAQAYVSFLSQTLSFVAGLYSYIQFEKRRRKVMHHKTIEKQVKKPKKKKKVSR